jgi:hypothetical protein
MIGRPGQKSQEGYRVATQLFPGEDDQGKAREMDSGSGVGRHDARSRESRLSGSSAIAPAASAEHAAMSILQLLAQMNQLPLPLDQEHGR